MNIENQSNNLAILSLTEKGVELAIKLAGLMENSTVYIPERLKFTRVNSPVVHMNYFNEWQETFSEAFNNYSRLVCIMAAGIVVRSLSPLIRSKFSDPAVIVVDEKGHYAISLLSGHIGGANRLAEEVAAKLHGEAVITTATDVCGKPAVDVLATWLNARLEPVKNLKVINRLLAEDKQVNLYSPLFLDKSVKDGFKWCGWPFMKDNHESQSKFVGLNRCQEDKFQEPAVIVSTQKIDMDSSCKYIQIKPKNLVIGIGCRKGVALQEVCRAFNKVMQEFYLHEKCVKTLATINIKSEEEAIKQFARKLDIPLLTFTKTEINTLDGTYESSEWVRKNIGVGGVCEPVARLAARGGITIVPKQKIGPVTISVAVEKSWWWDLDLETQIS